MTTEFAVTPKGAEVDQMDASTTLTTRDKYGALLIDPLQNDRAMLPDMASCLFWTPRRPHMRAFHFAWFSFFIAFLSWFSFAPLMSVVKHSLDLTDDQIWDSNIASVFMTVFFRFAIGPALDKYGARTLQSLLLILCSIPTFCAGLIQGYWGLIFVRMFIGIVGASFVGTQYWTSMMFTFETVGSANAITGGWGNLGGGVTQFFMPAVFNMLKDSGLSEEQAWRRAFVVPASMLLAVGIVMYLSTDDCPKGNYADLVARGEMKKTNGFKNFDKALRIPSAFFLLLLYGACFGVELTVNNMMASYFRARFGLGVQMAGNIASLFGLMNLFARAIGGFVSDFMQKRSGMKGRLYALFFCLIGEAVLLFTFSRMETLAGSIFFLMCFSVFVQASEGATFGVVPYVKPALTGAIAGMVGAGGNIGAVAWGLMFRYSGAETADCLMYLSLIVGALSMLTLFISIEDHGGILFGPPGLEPAFRESLRESRRKDGGTKARAQSGMEAV